MLDDLEDMTLMNAFVAFNRALLSAREFFLTLHDQSGFRATGLKPLGKGHQMRRNGTSTALTQHAEAFLITTLISPYRKARWANDRGAFATFYFGDDDYPKLQIGAFVSALPANLQWDYAWATDVQTLKDARLAALDKKHLPWATALAGRLELTYDERPWRPGEAEADVAWAMEKLATIAAGLK